MKKGRVELMTYEVKNAISELRAQGLGYKKIARETGINAETIKSYCRRHGLRGKAPNQGIEVSPLKTKPCEYCGGTVFIHPGRKVPRFCCDKCRVKWWNVHVNDVSRKGMAKYECPTCGKIFGAYEKRQRKYCSHECYIIARFG